MPERGKILYQILDFLGDAVLEQADFMQAVLQAGYGASGGKIEYKYSKLQASRHTRKIKKQELLRFQKYLSKLKSEGFILGKKSGQVSLSQKGKQKLEIFRNSFSLNKYKYTKEAGDKIVVVSYDLPIAFNRERDILREMLKLIGLQMVHKSVWVGKVKLPSSFIASLGQMNIINFVEILEVTKSGTLKDLK